MAGSRGILTFIDTEYSWVGSMVGARMMKSD